MFLGKMVAVVREGAMRMERDMAWSARRVFIATALVRRLAPSLEGGIFEVW